MDKVTENEKWNLKQKFIEFQKKGLESYGKYLADQLEHTSKSDIRQAYIKYLEDQIKMNNEKIKKIEEDQ